MPIDLVKLAERVPTPCAVCGEKAWRWRGLLRGDAYFECSGCRTKLKESLERVAQWIGENEVDEFFKDK